MESIRALIIDDEPIARRGIRRLLESEPDIEVIGECTDGREAIDAIEKQNPDLIFLDVQMPLVDGFGVIKEVGARNLPAVVFITAYDEHAIRAFEVNALDYVLKPVDPERFTRTLARAREHIGDSRTKRLDEKLTALLRSLQQVQGLGEPPPQPERIAIKKQGHISFIGTEEIDWLCAQGNYVQVHAGPETHLLRETVDGMERRLDPRKFVRLRRSTIVRTQQIKEMHPLFNGEYAVILKDGTRLQSSRRYRKNLDTVLKGTF